MTVQEAINFIHRIEEVAEKLKSLEQGRFEYASSEAYFCMNFENILEDNVVEVELWMNIGSQTKGEFFGYDEGVRFIVSEMSIALFLLNIKKEFSNTLGIFM